MNHDTIRNWQLMTLNNNLNTVESILRSAPPDALTTYRDGGTGWTALEVLCHLRELESIILQRAQVTMAQDNPPLPAPDADEMAAAGNYNAQDMETVLADWKARRATYITYMQERSGDDWQRVGVHPRRGPLTLLDQFTFLAAHDSMHIEQMTRVLHEQAYECASMSVEGEYATLPITVDDLTEQFAACGMAAGQTVLVHTSMRKIGWVLGGAQAVIQALLRVLGPTGTLMMPTQTTENTEPSYWQHPPVPESAWPIIRAHTPAYDPATSPTRLMGRVAELFRTWPGVLRSSHPVGSFAALGPNAHRLLDNHPLEDEFGDGSPANQLYTLDGYVMLLGVNHSNNTSLHMAERRANWPSKRTIRQGSAMLVNGQRQWVEYETLDLGGDDFETLGDAYEAEHGIPRHRVGQAEVRFMKQRPLIDYAVAWIEHNRT